MMRTKVQSALVGLLAVVSFTATVSAQPSNNVPATVADSAATHDHVAAPAPTTPATAQSLVPGTLYYVQGDKLTKVEETPIESGASVGAGSAIAGAVLGFGGGAKSWMSLHGKTSELTITETQPHFRLACERSVALSLRLGIFEIKGEKRRAQVDPGKLDVFKRKMELTMTKTAEGVYEFSPEKPLKTGEYAFSAGYGSPVADFTIVEADTKEKKE